MRPWPPRLRYLDQALEVNRVAGNRWGEAWTLASRGKALCDRGQLDAARAHWREALAIFDQLGDPRSAEIRSYLNHAP
ncbi:hypothetical protein [Amycolatopsis minnesotensis]|uniref:Tetratricopeptide repeat protein n=1 Tax=Amycolatopsis minnesotensis TaxID=337894 RepID=A0ABN2SRS0_9PSEU